MAYKEMLDKMVWSFSRIHMYEDCPYAFYLKYIEENEGVDNFWAENGRAVHKVLEKVLGGKIRLEDAPSHYVDLYENMCCKTNESTMEGTFNACLDFFCEFDFDFFKNYEVLGVEQEIKTKIGKYEFTGFIDLLLRDTNTGEIMIWDYKSSKYPFQKNGKSVLKNCEDSFGSYKHQMYIYSKYVIEKYGKPPEKIVWLHFKDQKMAEIDFDEEEYEETLKWAVNTIKKIYSDKKFSPKKSFMTCNKLCDFRDGDCEYKELEE